MDHRERRIQKWLDEPDCSRKLAEGIVAQEDAEDEIDRLQGLLYGAGDIRIIQMIERGTRKLAEAVEAESELTNAT
jgi:hypothetical protein